MAEINYPLPGYLSSAKPNPKDNRSPWYMNIAPSYAGIFLWIAFYDQLAPNTLNVGGIGATIIGLILAGLISFVLFYLAPALWGMKTGYPLYIIGSSTFGEKGGYFLPGLFMGILQVGWYGVATYFSTQFVLNAVMGLQNAPEPMSASFIIVGFIWGYIFAFIGMKGIEYVAKMSLFFPIVPLVMLIYAALAGSSGLSEFELSKYGVENPSSIFAILMVIQVVVGFFATAGAAGADFGMSNRDKGDIFWGGFVGVAVAIFVCGTLPILAIAGMIGLNPELAQGENAWTFTQTIGNLAGNRIMFLLFAVASMAPACFCSFIFANSFSTMIPAIPRMAWAFGGATVGILLAVTGAAENLQSFFGFIGASFGPICGAMAADYLLCGGKWPGPRKGINWAGYIAVITGFIVGIIPNLAEKGVLPVGLTSFVPAAVYSFIVGFVLYLILAKADLEPEVIPYAKEEMAKEGEVTSTIIPEDEIGA